jgi:hypothetical protein
MPIRNSGPLPITEIVQEFGGSVPHALTEYYADGVFIKNQYSPPTPVIPSKGGPPNNTIKISNFYGKGKRKQVIVTITANESSLNVYSKFRALIQSEPVDIDAILVINSGVTISGNPALWVPADDNTRTHGFKSTDLFTIKNNGNIVGNQGLGGAPGCGAGVGGSNGTVGGTAIQLYRSTSIENNGTIAGGGSGGKGGTGGNITTYNQKPVAGSPAVPAYCPPATQKRSPINVCNYDENCRGAGWTGMNCACRRPWNMKPQVRQVKGHYGRMTGQSRSPQRGPCTMGSAARPGAAQNNDVTSTNTCGGKGGDGASPFNNVTNFGGGGGGGGATAGENGGLWGSGGSYLLRGSNFLTSTIRGTSSGLISPTP